MKKNFWYVLITLLLLFHCAQAFPSWHFTDFSTKPNGPTEPRKYQPLQFRAGFTTGWKAPYGTGLDFNFLVYEVLDVNVGCGIGTWGAAKTGLGARLYPIRGLDFSPMVGVYIFDSSGQDTITVTKQYYFVGRGPLEAKYRIEPDKAVQINVGFRYGTDNRICIISGAGYSFSLNGKNAEYLSGSTLDELRSKADLYRIGGFSVHFGISISLLEMF